MWCLCLSPWSGLYLWQNGTGFQQEADAERNHGNWEGLGDVDDWTVSILLQLAFWVLVTFSFATHGATHKVVYTVNIISQFQRSSFIAIEWFRKERVGCFTPAGPSVSFIRCCWVCKICGNLEWDLGQMCSVCGAGESGSDKCWLWEEGQNLLWSTP